MISYDCCGLRSCPNLKSCFDVLIDDDKKVASSKKHTQFKTRNQRMLFNIFGSGVEIAYSTEKKRQKKMEHNEDNRLVGRVGVGGGGWFLLRRVLYLLHQEEAILCFCCYTYI